MATTVPYVPNTTWADGSGGGTPVTAAKLNAVEQGLTDAHRMPAVRVYHSASQSIANSTVTALALNTERFDTAGGLTSTQHDTATNNSRLTCRYAGKYMIIGQAEWAANATGVRALAIRLNGATIVADVAANAGAAVTIVQDITTLYDLAVNDYVELTAFQTSGVALNVNAAPNYSPEFMMSRVA